MCSLSKNVDFVYTVVSGVILSQFQKHRKNRIHSRLKFVDPILTTRSRKRLLELNYHGESYWTRGTYFETKKKKP